MLFRSAFSTGEVFLSPSVIEEIDATIRRLSSKIGEEKTGYLLTLWKRFQSHCTILLPREKAAICRDPKDDAYLHLCIAARADFLVTGDKDLLAVHPAAQGRGVGAALLNATPKVLHLETFEKTNVDWYVNRGFRLTGEVRSPVRPTFWALRRG